MNIQPDPIKIRINPENHFWNLNLGELYAYRELIYYFTWRDLKVRYKQTVLGVSWAIFQPLVTMFVFSLFFGRLAGMPSDGVPYPLFSLAALVPWTFFANSVTLASNSLVLHSDMIKKIYFPRQALPLATILASLVDFVLAFLVLLITMTVVFRVYPTHNIIYLPFLILLTMITSLGVGLWFATLNVRYRDIRYIVPFLVQVWMFISPVAYPSSLLTEPLRTLYAINPMVGVIEGFRWALLGVGSGPGPMIYISSIVAVLIFVSGLLYFNNLEAEFADVI
jgi:lipopolysaccharide transport system permease protein